MAGYVHGYGTREAERLGDQESTLRDLLHRDTGFPRGALVLEPGCGTGAQTVTLARANPHVQFVSFDREAGQLARARVAIAETGLANVSLLRGDLYRPPFPPRSFDYLFLCFVLEHLSDPITALRGLKDLVRPGGTVTVIEGDHGSCYFHPETAAARAAWQCLIDSQHRLGANSLIGRQLYRLAEQAGLTGVRVSPRMVYGDGGNPALRHDFVKKVIIPMVEGVQEQSLKDGLIDEATWRQGIADLHRTGEPPDGVFCYCFFKMTAALP